MEAELCAQFPIALLIQPVPLDEGIRVDTRRDRHAESRTPEMGGECSLGKRNIVVFVVALQHQVSIRAPDSRETRSRAMSSIELSALESQFRNNGTAGEAVICNQPLVNPVVAGRNDD